MQVQVAKKLKKHFRRRSKASLSTAGIRLVAVSIKLQGVCHL